MIKEFITTVFFAVLLHLLSLTNPDLLIASLVTVGAISTYFSLRIGVSFGPKITFGRAFTFLGISFACWSSALLLEWFNYVIIVHILKVAGYFFSFLCLYNLQKGLRKTKGRRSIFLPLIKLFIILTVPIIYGYIMKVSYYTMILQIFVLLTAGFVYYIIRTRATGEFSRGLTFLLTASLLLCVFYLTNPIASVNWKPATEITYIAAWFFGLWGLIRINQDLGFGKFYM